MLYLKRKIDFFLSAWKKQSGPETVDCKKDRGRWEKPNPSGGLESKTIKV